MKIKAVSALLLAAACVMCPYTSAYAADAPALPQASDAQNKDKEYIRWVDFDITADALRDAADADVAAHAGPRPLSWIELLAYLGQKYGGDFSRYKKSDLTAACAAYETRSFEEQSKNKKLYRYYCEAYGATLGGLLGDYILKTAKEDGSFAEETGYGIRAYSPIARGYSYSHYDDFGVARSYGYKRCHLGHDMMGSIGTPIVAVEDGYVEALGWNQYGGWRVGIRSYDGRRYYYYAHLRRNHPFPASLAEGDYVEAGQVIGYLGMTGYSAKENVNNINTPHLHYGLQLVFDPSQKDGTNQIWIDMYQLTNFLERYRVSTVKSSDGTERISQTTKRSPEAPD